jgi:YwiC-like protein
MTPGAGPRYERRVGGTGSAAGRRALVPHEHGAYGQLLFPLATALALGRPGAAACALTAAAVLAFVAHEPLVVALGRRGPRLRGERGAEAQRLLVLLGAGALLAGAAGTALAPPAARLAVAFSVALAAVVAALVAAGRERGLAGELVIATALASPSCAVALGAGVSMRVAVACLVTWVLSFAAAVVVVRAVIERIRTRGASDHRAAAALVAAALLAAAFALAGWRVLPAPAAYALVPKVVVVLGLAVVPPPPRRLGTAGWLLAAASVATAVVLVAGLR